GKPMWLFAESAGVDDGIDRINVDVSYRKKVPMHADCARLIRGNRAKSFGIARIADSSEGHGVGKSGHKADTRKQTAFKIGRHQQRQFGVTLQLVGKGGNI